MHGQHRIPALCRRVERTGYEADRRRNVGQRPLPSRWRQAGGRLASSHMVDELNINLLFPINTGAPSEVSRVLSLLESEPLAAPTHASRDARKRLPYDRPALLDALAGRPISGLHLWRSKAPKYSNGYLSANDRTHNHVVADYAGAGLNEQRLAELFAVWTRLAEATRTEFGFVHSKFRNDQSEAYNYGVRVRLKDLRDYGLLTLYARTWFGPDLLAVIGEKRLLSIPNTRKTSWGGVELDLVEQPWLADFDTLFRRQKELGEVFRSWGVMGNYEDIVQTLPGPSWTPRTWGLG